MQSAGLAGVAAMVILNSVYYTGAGAPSHLHVRHCCSESSSYWLAWPPWSFWTLCGETGAGVLSQLNVCPCYSKRSEPVHACCGRFCFFISCAAKVDSQC